MAPNPSSSHHRDHRDRDHDRSERHSSSRRHHHHRTISSTTLLLVLSLVLAVLAVMLSMPKESLTGGAAPAGDAPNGQGFWGLVTPKRTQAIIARESSVAHREAEVARREAELLVGAPGGVLPTPSPVPCPICPPPAEPIVQTVIKEVFKDVPTNDVAQSGWYKEAAIRMDDILDRELKIADREREIGKREETVNRREHDASRREAWIMEQLMVLGDGPGGVVEEEYVYDTPGAKRYPKELPPLVLTETAVAFETMTVTETQHHTFTQATRVTVPAPANTRNAHFPTPVVAAASSYSTTHIPKTTSVEIITEEELPLEEPAPTVMVHHAPQGGRARPPKRWLGAW